MSLKVYQKELLLSIQCTVMYLLKFSTMVASSAKTICTDLGSKLQDY